MSNDQETRNKYVGSSDVPVILGVSPYKTKRQLWLEKCGMSTPEDISLREAVLLGSEMESIIRERVESELGFSLPAKTFTNGYRRAQLDGFNEEQNIMVEIKTCGKDRFSDAEKRIIYDDHLFQIMWQLWLSGAKLAKYCCMLVKEDKLTTMDVHPDQELFNKLAGAADAFWTAVQTNTEPDEHLLDPTARVTIAEWSKAKSELDAAKAKFEELDGAVKGYLEDRKIEALEWKGFKAITVERVGNVDYKKIDVLKGLDLEQYRAKPSKFYKLSMKESV